ncbi:ketoacyl-ACP synthase III [Marinilongibacter aquaticus]|uniref:3-oxoacyl-ACP synthase III family protein n=1 Tax=Marinilongibacter aquaticus TaxID=2975157 RepID=UPI0021BD89A5|nr:ketoacyl-ACP synthase III [Marinilongibacter aquaticus]UBM57226.1 ketoacyl-ACP synthase III [Marinilongibacter aquaticus]
MGAILSGTGSALPKDAIRNDYFLDWSFYDKSGSPISKPGEAVIENLERISGIKERRYIGKEQESMSILMEAAQKAIADAGVDKENIDGIIVAHNAGNMLECRQSVFSTVPNLAALLKNRLGIANHHCPAYDILFGCPGWVEACIQANRLIQAGEATHVLVCGLEVASRFLDKHDMDSMLMGDGCGAAVFSANADSSKGILSTATFSHAREDVDFIRLGDSLNPEAPKDLTFKMSGKDVYRYATTWLPQVIAEALNKVNLTPKDIDLFFFHQANAKMLEAIAFNLMKMYGQEHEDFAKKIPISIHFTGNTSVATVPTLLDLVRQGHFPNFKINNGQKLVFASVGAGMHCNAIVYQN